MARIDRSWASSAAAAARRSVPFVAAALVAVYPLLTYRGALSWFFFLDDWWVMRDAAGACGADGWSLAGLFQPGPAGLTLFRPLTTVAYACALHSLFGYDASGYHAAQLLAFTLNGLLVFDITRRLTGSTLGALAAGLLFVAAPGQAVGVYWLSAFTVTGTALALLAMLWCWVTLRGRTRMIFCAVLQALALLASEHAVTGPLLVAALSAALPQRPRWRDTLVGLAPSMALVGAYVGAKAYYAMFVRPPLGPYVPSLDPRAWLRHLGRYLAVCFTPTTLHPLADGAALAIGAALVGLIAWAAWRASRGAPGWRLVAAGGAVFVISLTPVLPLATLFRAHYIGLAALGAVLLVLGLCQLLTRRWAWLALGLSAASLGTGVLTAHRAWRAEPIFRLVEGGSNLNALWIATLQRTALEAPGAEVWLPRDPATGTLIALGRVPEFFPGLPRDVRLYDRNRPPEPSPGRIILQTPIRPLTPDSPLPGEEARWAWLRRLAR